jgi:lipopolysaccharide transport system permease protein
VAPDLLEEAITGQRTQLAGSASNDGSRSLTHHRISPDPPPLRVRVRELLDARDLFVILLGRELQVRYKQTALGVVWVLLQPLVPAVIFAVVFGTFARLPSAGAPYILFALSGLVIFGLFSGAVGRAGASLVRDGQLITKIYFPRAILPLASGSAGLVDVLVGLAVVLVLMLGLGHPPTAAILALPFIVGLTLALALGLGLAVAALSAHYRDFGYVVPFVLQVLLYGSPVVYSMEIVPPALANIYAINPLVPLIEAFRWSLLGTPPPTGEQILLGSVTGALMFIAGLVVFSRASRDVADVI